MVPHISRQRLTKYTMADLVYALRHFDEGNCDQNAWRGGTACLLLKKAPATGRGFWGYAEVRQFNWSRFNSRKATENLANS